MYEYGPYRKTSIKLNYNCPESEKVGSGPGSCSGKSENEPDNPEEAFWDIEEGRARAGNWGGKATNLKKAGRKPGNDSIENEPDDSENEPDNPEEAFWDIEEGRTDRRGAWGGNVKQKKARKK